MLILHSEVASHLCLCVCLLGLCTFTLCTLYNLFVLLFLFVFTSLAMFVHVRARVYAAVKLIIPLFYGRQTARSYMQNIPPLPMPAAGMATAT